MQEMQKRQKEAQILNDMLNDKAGAYRRSLEGRIEHNKDLQYNQHKNLFATGYSTIHKAACDGSESGIVYFLDRKEKPRINVDDYDKFGICPIHYAAERGYNDAITLLLKRGCNIDVPTMDGMTPFMYACKDNRLSTMRLLCDAKADLLAVNRAGMSCAHFAAQLDHIDVFELLVQLNIEAKERALTEIADLEMAVENPDQAAAEADKKARREQHAAELKKEAEGEKKAGADDIDDDATIATAETSNSKKSKDSKGGGDKGKPGLVSGAPDLDEDPVEALRKKYETMINLPDTAIVDITSRNGTRPIHIAATYNALKVIEFLIKTGADINAQDTAGESSMHKAARRGNHDAFKLLKAAGGYVFCSILLPSFLVFVMSLSLSLPLSSNQSTQYSHHLLQHYRYENVRNTSRETALELLKDASMI
jgi:ankyrin repeat protein